MTRGNHIPLRALTFVAVIWLALVGGNAVWLSREATAPFVAYEAADHAVASVHIYRDLAGSGSVIDRVRTVARQAMPYPPLVHTLAAARYAVAGIPEDGHGIAVTAWTLNALFLALTLTCTYSLGRNMMGRGPGVLGALLTAAYPMVFSQARYFMLDVPLTAVVTLSLWLLWRTDGFHDRTFVLLFGATAGFGMLTKQACGLFLIGPAVWVLIAGLRRRVDRLSRLRTVANGGIAVAAAVAVCAWWYGDHLRAAWHLEWLVYNPLDLRSPECTGQVLSVCGVTYYLRALTAATSSAYLVLFVVAAAALIAARHRPLGIGFLAAWFGAGYLVLTMFAAKQPRFMMPLLPAVALISAAGLSAFFETRILRARAAHRALVAAIAGAGALQFAVATFASHHDGAAWPTDRVLDAVLAHYDARCPGHRGLPMGIRSPDALGVIDPIFYSAAVRAPFLTGTRISQSVPADYSRYVFVVLHTPTGAAAAPPAGGSSFTLLWQGESSGGHFAVLLNRDAMAAAQRVDALKGSIGATLEPDGHVAVTEHYRPCVAVFTGDGMLVRDWGGEGGEPGEFQQPRGIAADAHANLYVADYGNNRIQVFDPNGRMRRTFGTWGDRPGEFKGPWGVAVATDGTVFVSDTGNGRIQAFDATGKFLRAWGELGGGPGPLGRLNNPRGMALDPAGSLYVVDADNMRIMKFTATGRYLTDWGSPGTNDGQFRDPIGIWVDQTGVYVIDKGRGAVRVQRFDFNGRFLAAIRDGLPSSPMDVIRARDGTLYSTDFEGPGLHAIGHSP